MDLRTQENNFDYKPLYLRHFMCSYTQKKNYVCQICQLFQSMINNNNVYYTFVNFFDLFYEKNRHMYLETVKILFCSDIRKKRRT